MLVGLEEGLGVTPRNVDLLEYLSGFVNVGPQALNSTRLGTYGIM